MINSWFGGARLSAGLKSRSRRKGTRSSIKLGLGNTGSPWVFLGIWLALGWPASWGADASPQSWRDYARKSQFRQAYGMYLAEQKLGWAVEELKLGDWRGKPVAVQTAEIHGRFAAEGRESLFEEKTINYFSLEGQGELVGGEESVTTDKVQTVRTITREGDQIKILTRSSGSETARLAPVPRLNLSLMQRLEVWLSRPPAAGAKMDNYSIAWEENDVNQKEIITFRGAKTIAWGGVNTRVYLVSVQIKGALMEAEMIAGGIMIKGQWGGFVELRAEKETVARQPGNQLVDMIEVSALKVDQALDHPETLVSLTVELTGLDQFPMPVSSRQRILSRDRRSLVLELRRDSRLRRGQPLPSSVRQQFLKSTPSIQSDHPEIRRLAREIVGPEKNPVKRANRLQRWVNEHIRAQMAANASTAMDVLQQRAGDCTELTLLFMALARSTGLPAREVGGVMFINEGQPQFGWHAWAEIHDGRQWVSVDPTWNQVFVDATHIKFSEGNEDWAWLNLLHKIKIRVVKFAR